MRLSEDGNGGAGRREVITRALALLRAGDAREAPDDADARAALALIEAGQDWAAEAVLADAAQRRRAA